MVGVGKTLLNTKRLTESGQKLVRPAIQKWDGRQVAYSSGQNMFEVSVMENLLPALRAKR